MKKRICMMMVLALLAGILSGCQLLCKHEWEAATCEVPQTCVKCEKIEGEALGHAWAEATCVDPEICSTCGQTQGAALGHAWVEATCEEPKTCTVCSLTEGEALGHTWEEATTEAPQTCTVCQATEGEPLDTDDRFTTAATKELQGAWVTYMEGSSEDLGLEGFEGSVEMAMYANFSNVGDFSLRVELADEEGFRQAMIDYIKAQTYAEFKTMGLDEETADIAMMAAYGMSMDDYVATTVDSIDFNELLGAIDVTMAYYVEGDQLYTAANWNAVFTNETFKIENGELTMETLVDEETGEPQIWTRVEE